jgi:hypothetical protein
MKTPQPLVLASLLLIIAACSSREVTLIDPQSGATVSCSGSGFGLGIGWAESYLGACTRRNEATGYVQLENLTSEQRADLERRGLLRRQ